MSQWKAQSLVILCVTFLAFLFIFNLGAFQLGKSVNPIPFQPSERGYEVNIANLSLSNLPISVESYPLSGKTSYISILCGDEAEVYDQIISLSEEYYLSLFSLCDRIKIEIWPKHENIGFWVRGHNPTHSLIVFLARAGFISATSIAFYLLFQSGKNNSVMRSILITQTSVILILDPLQLISTFFPSISLLHALISCIGWWRAVAEIFAEYGPLVRHHKNSTYRIIAAVPSLILFICVVSEKMSRFSCPKFIFALGTVGACVLPIAAVVFLTKARHVSGMCTLAVHVISGTLTMSIAYIMKFMRNVHDDFRDSLFCEIAEISFVGAYAMFQTVFQFGESREKPSLISQGPMRRVESIDGMLDTMGDFGNTVTFDVSDSHEEKE